MYDHIGLKVRDLAASARFYGAALKTLGLAGSSDEASASYGRPESDPGLYLSQGEPGGPVHIAFRSPDRSAVDAFHAAGLAAGGRDNGAPGLREDYSPTYYAAFLIDPDGNNVEAVCTAQV
jgi:catechol 2,3-dioxygenase-like lactoylglutathione lyase family enzyme